jgi:hypothetical protein
MYTLSDFVEATNNPKLIVREINRLYHTNFNCKSYNKKGVDIFSQDWDNLIILDACRFDIFKKYCDINGKMEAKVSRGATSHEFIRGNFAGKKAHDTVYISGNSWFARLHDQIDTEVHDFSHFSCKSQNRAEKLTKKAEEWNYKYPNKRLIVHYMLPHDPYIGSTAEKMRKSKDAKINIPNMREGKINIPDNKLRQLYIENLEYVMKYVKKILKKLSGKTVVSADHGELLGDRVHPIPHKEYGHIGGLYVPELVNVPWLIYENGQRKSIVSEEPIRNYMKDISDRDVKKNLKKLGYI